MDNLFNWLGVTATDRITGFKGVITGISGYISGCSQALVVPPMREDKLPDPQWFDVQRMVADISVPRVILDNTATPGCDRQAPKR